MRDNLIHYVHLKRELKLLLGFNSHPSHLTRMWRCVVYVYICYVLVLFVNGGWYSSCSDTRSLFTWQCELKFHLHAILHYYNLVWAPVCFGLFLSQQLHTSLPCFTPASIKHDDESNLGRSHLYDYMQQSHYGVLESCQNNELQVETNQIPICTHLIRIFFQERSASGNYWSDGSHIWMIILKASFIFVHIHPKPDGFI